MVKLTKFKGKNELNEIFQSLDIKFAFVHQKEDGNFEQIHQPGKCRDYLGDFPWNKHYPEQKVQIYGMEYSYKEFPYDGDALKLSITFPGESSRDFFLEEKKLAFLDRKCKEAGVDEVKILETNDPLTIIVIADKWWQHMPWKISLFTFYIKMMSYEDEHHLRYPENEYIGSLTAHNENCLLSKVTDPTEFFYEDLHDNHNNSGWLSVCHNKTNVHWKYIFAKEKTCDANAVTKN